MVALGFGLLAFLAVSFVAISALNVSRTRRAMLRRRIEPFVPSASNQRSSTVEVLRVERPPLIKQLDLLVEGTSAAEGLSVELMRADLPLRPGEFVAIRIVVALALFAIAYFVSGNVLISIVMLPLSYIAIRVYVKHRQQARIDAFERQLPEAIDLLNTSLKSGFGLLQGLETIAREMPRPIKDEFSQVVRDMSVGMQLDDALQAMCGRVPSHDAYLLVTAVMIHRAVGGNLSEVLSGIAQTIRARLRIRAEVHALTTTPRVSSYVVAGLPFLVFALMYMVNPPYILLLFTTGVGRVMLAIGGSLMAIGMFVSQRVIQVDY